MKPYYEGEDRASGEQVTITEFLLARIAEDEADAQHLAAALDRWNREREANGPDGSQGSIVAAILMMQGTGDPARVLADCEAKRRLVIDLDFDHYPFPTPHTPWRGCGDDCEWKVADYVLAHLALSYADHPSYDEDWRP